MTHPAISRRGLLAGVACAVALAGCSLLPDPPPAQIYRLRSDGIDPENGPPLRSQLAIDVPTVPQSLDTDRIALIRGGTRFDYYADSVWTDRVPMLLQNLLVQAFETSGRIADVGRDLDTLLPGYRLETDVRDFQACYTGMADRAPVIAINFALRLVRTPDRRPAGETLIASQAPAAGNNLDGVVEAFDVAVGTALTRSVAWTLHAMGQGSRSA